MSNRQISHVRSIGVRLVSEAKVATGEGLTLDLSVKKDFNKLGLRGWVKVVVGRRENQNDPMRQVTTPALNIPHVALKPATHLLLHAAGTKHLSLLREVVRR